MNILKKISDHEILFTFLLLLSGILLLYGRAIIAGESIVPGDIPYNTAVWQGYSPKTEYYKAKNYLLSDQINQFYVWHHLASQSMRINGKIPSWNPYEFTGQPLIANSQSSLFYPPNLLLFFLSPGKVATARAVFNLFAAGIFIFLFCRELGISRSGATLSSIAFAFSGPVTVWLGHPHINVFVWIPFLLWTAEKLLKTKQHILWGLISGTGIGISILGGHPETTFHVLIIYFFYLFLRTLLKKRGTINIRKLVSGILLAVLAGVLLGSVQLLPFTEFLLNSGTLSSGGRSGAGSNIFYGDKWSEELFSAITLMYPNFFGNPVDRNYYYPFGTNNYNEQTIYFGLIPLMFAFGALFIPKKSRKLIILIVLALFSVAIAWGLPGFNLINHLPIFFLVSNGRMRMVFCFLSIMLAGFGFDFFKKYINHMQKYRRVFLAMISVPLSSVLIIMGISVVKTVIIAKELLNPVTKKYAFTYGNHLLFNIFSFKQAKTIIPAAVAAVILLIFLLQMKGKLSFSFITKIMILTVFIELIVFAWGYNPTIKESDILPENPVIRYLKRDKYPSRMITVGKSYFPNYNVPHRIFHLGGYDLPVFQSYSDIFKKAGGGNIHNHSWKADSELINFLNVKYVVATKKSKVPEKFIFLKSIGAVDIYENPHVMPRAFMVYNYVPVEDSEAALNRIMEKNFNFLKNAVFTDGLPEKIISDLEENRDKPGYFKIDFINYRNDSIDIEVYTSKGGLLVCSEIHVPGWKAELDNNEIPVFTANYAFRSVYVTAGRHKLKFYYDPLSIKIGGIFSMSALLLLFVYIGYYVFRRRRRRQERS